MEPAATRLTQSPDGLDLVLGAVALGGVLAALGVISSELIATDAVYDTRVRWLLLAAVPLLVVAAGISALALQRARRREVSPIWVRMLRATLWVACGLALVPVVVVALVLVIYGILFIRFEVGHLFL